MLVHNTKQPNKSTPLQELDSPHLFRPVDLDSCMHPCTAKRSDCKFELILLLLLCACACDGRRSSNSEEWSRPKSAKTLRGKDIDFQQQERKEREFSGNTDCYFAQIKENGVRKRFYVSPRNSTTYRIATENKYKYCWKRCRWTQTAGKAFNRGDQKSNNFFGRICESGLHCSQITTENKQLFSKAI